MVYSTWLLQPFCLSFGVSGWPCFKLNRGSFWHAKDWLQIFFYIFKAGSLQIDIPTFSSELFLKQELSYRGPGFSAVWTHQDLFQCLPLSHHLYLFEFRLCWLATLVVDVAEMNIITFWRWTMQRFHRSKNCQMKSWCAVRK